MPLGPEAQLQSTTAAVAGVLLFRALPFLVYAAACARVPLLHKAALAAGSGLFALACARLAVPVGEIAAGALAGLLYFAMAGVLVHRARDWLRMGGLDRPAFFVLCVALFAVVPGLAPLPFRIPALAVGWERSFAAYSYGVDTSADDERPPLREALFFLLVNPQLVYRMRGTALGHGQLDPRGLARIALGFAAMVCQLYALSLLGAQRGTWVRDLGPVPSFALYHAGLAFALYCAHSGLASMQIGMMQLIGWRVPERYRLPWLARSPADFWRRWNIWLGEWARRYLFNPLALWLRRRARHAHARFALQVAAALTFLAIGALHDLALLLARHDPGPRPLGFTLLFAAIAASYALWNLGARLLAAPARAIARLPRALLQWCALACVQIALIWLAAPLL